MSLLDDLRGADMLLIDGLHAWQFELDEQAQGEQPQVVIECMDGRTRRVWRFSAMAVATAQAVDDSGCWRIRGSDAEHQLVCLGAIRADNDDDEDELSEEG